MGPTRSGFGVLPETPSGISGAILQLAACQLDAPEETETPDSIS